MIDFCRVFLLYRKHHSIRYALRQAWNIAVLRYPF